MVLNRISKEDVHNITSGQVITELSSIVKELLDNAVDAGATAISITFKRYGLEGIEISDNGDGIKSDDFESICLKNYTSKLENFQSLSNVKTLGFRGEALNSICNMSTMKISTATALDAPKGWELTFNQKGELSNRKMVNQSKGTTIVISDIFKKLPVRKLNLEKNYKKEFQKCTDMLTSYMLILKGVRIIITNVDVTGRKKLVLKTSGNEKMKDNVVNIFGSSGLQGLRDIEATLALDDLYHVTISGLISSSSIGDGRLSRDRQYIYINRRPVTYKPLVKHITESYKKVNYLQSPVIILNLELSEAILDVNVTPDKRTVMISRKYETLILEKVLEYLETFWDTTDYSIPVNSDYQEKINERNERNEPLVQIKLDSFAFTQDESSQNSVQQSSEEVCILEKACATSSYDVSIGGVSDEIDDDEEDAAVGGSEAASECNEDNFLSSLPTGNPSNDRSSSAADVEVFNDSLILEKNVIKYPIDGSSSRGVPSSEGIIEQAEVSILEENFNGNAYDHVHEHCHQPQHDKSVPNVQDTVEDTGSLFVPESSGFSTDDILADLDKEPVLQDSQTYSARVHKVRISREDLKLNHKKQKLSNDDAERKQYSVESMDFTDRDLSEKMLTLSINKNDFMEMEIIGQFNKGFIIVHKKDTHDILIVDQHASDEKFNFEKLNNETTFENQPLVVPQKLDVNSIEKLIILSNLEVFEKNGFKFKTEISDSDHSDEEHDGNAGKQENILLTSLPYSKNTIFNLKDMDELLQLVTDRSNFTSLPRPTKVRSMFAMRACRSSIMIGQSLSKSRMTKVVQNLSTLDKPWNCPHGRPTMRHIAKIDQWQPSDDDYGA